MIFYGLEYYKYFLLYTYDTLLISENGEYVLRYHIGNYFELKEESIGSPRIYLSERLCRVDIENSIKLWVFGSTQYVRAAVDNVEVYLR